MSTETVTCPSCGKLAKATDSFCPECGYALAPLSSEGATDSGEQARVTDGDLVGKTYGPPAPMKPWEPGDYSVGDQSAEASASPSTEASSSAVDFSAGSAQPAGPVSPVAPEPSPAFQPQPQAQPTPTNIPAPPPAMYGTPTERVAPPMPGQGGYPVPVYNQSPMAYQQGQFECPYCHTHNMPYVRERVSQTGWILVVVLLLVCFPLFWIGLLQKETYRVCSNCGMQLY